MTSAENLEKIRQAFVYDGFYIQPGLFTSTKIVPGTIEFGYMFDNIEEVSMPWQESFEHSLTGKTIERVMTKLKRKTL